MRQLSLLFLLFTLWSSSTSQAQEHLWTEVYDAKDLTQVKATALFNRLPTSGYLPVRIELTNGQLKDLNWKLYCKSTDSRWKEESLYSSNYAFTCPAGETATYEIYVPVITPYLNSSGGGYGRKANIHFTMTCDSYPEKNQARLSSNHMTEFPEVLVSDEILLHNSDHLDIRLHSTYTARYSGSYKFGSSFTPDALPEDWRGYIGYEVMVISADAMAQISSGARVSLQQWLRGGGNLIVLRPSASENFKTLNIETDSSSGDVGTVGSGQIYLKTISDITRLEAHEIDYLIETVSKSREIPQFKSFVTDFSKKWGLLKDFGSKNFNPILLAIILLIFAIIVGPINLFVFAKSGQRHRLFYTTPLISLVASLLLIVLIVFQDGFGGSGVRNQHIQLGAKGEPYADIYQEQISRTGVLLSTSITSKEQLPLTPVLLPNSDWARMNMTNRGAQSRYAQEISEDGVKLTGDFFQSRSEQAHTVRHVAPSYGRIELVDGMISSTLAYPIDLLYYKNSENKLFTAKNIKPGAKVALTPMTETKLKKTDIQKKFSASRSRQISRVINTPNSFVAFTKDAPGIETYSGIEWTDTHTIITGPLN